MAGSVLKQRSGTAKVLKAARKPAPGGKADVRVVITPGRRSDFIPMSYADIYLAAPQERIVFIRAGVPAIVAETTSKAIGFPKEKLFTTLHFARATVNRKIASNGLLSQEYSERLLGLRKLIGQVEVMVAESGTAQGFDAPQWVGQWLEQPCPALGGEKPVSFMDTLEGQEIVSGVLARIQSGAYA